MLTVIIGVVALAGGFAGGFLYRKKVSEKEISSAEEEGRRIVNEAIRNAESKKKEALLEAKEEILKSRTDYEKEEKSRRADLQRQENRLQQKEENLDRKLETIEKKEESLAQKHAAMEKEQEEIRTIKQSQTAMLEKISGFTADEAKMGYVGAFTYAEVVSGYTSFYLGAKSVCPTVTMDVTFTGSWYDETLEKEGAEKLIQGGCKLISQHADSLGAPTACENAGVPNVSYNGSTVSACPNTYIISSRINWAPYYEMCIKAVMDGTEIPADWTGTLATNSVVLTDLNTTVAAEGTAEAIAAATEKLEKGEIHVFDCSTFTVKGEALTSYMADVDTDDAYTPDTEVVHDGYFSESEFRSAPYFDLQIDGINLLDTNFGG